MKTKAWVVFVDIFGFKEMVNRAEKSKKVLELVDSVNRVWKEVQQEIKESAVKPKLYRFSDCAFLIYPVKDEKKEKISKLEAIMEQLSAIMNTFVTNEYPLRGGMAFGEVAFDKAMLAGKPVIMAHSYENMVPAPAVLLPAKEVIEKPYSTTRPHGVHFKLYLLKDNMTVYCHLIQPSPVSAQTDYIANQIRDASFYGPYDLATKWIIAKDYAKENMTEVKE